MGKLKKKRKSELRSPCLQLEGTSNQNLKSQVADVARGHSAGLQRKSSACVGAVEQVVMMVAPWSRGFS